VFLGFLGCFGAFWGDLGGFGVVLGVFAQNGVFCVFFGVLCVSAPNPRGAKKTVFWGAF